MDLGLTVEARGERREGRHRRSSVRGEKGVRRRNATRRTRAHPRRVGKAKEREGVRGKRRVNLRNVQGNARGRRGRERPGLGTNRTEETRPRLTVGVDEGERTEQGRASFADRREKTQTERVGRRHSHAPVTTEANLDVRRTAERRRPRKTWVETDQRRTNLEGKAVWTTGVGAKPSQAGREGETRGSLPEARSEARSGGREDEARSMQRKTRGVKTVDGAWNERRRPDRYGYYREGHPRARASKVMASCARA
jgi:hypothetical protein